MPRVLAIAIAGELLCDIVYIVMAIVTKGKASIPGDELARLALAGCLGLVVVIWRSRWACWLLAGIEYLTAAACLIFSFATFPSFRPSFSPVPLAAGVGYSCLALAMTVGGQRLRAVARPIGLHP
jgi:hypothetical protein